jgi:hypothetical protein
MDADRAESLRFTALAEALGVREEYERAFVEGAMEIFADEIEAGFQTHLGLSAVKEASVKHRTDRFRQPIQRLQEKAGTTPRSADAPEPTMADLLFRAANAPSPEQFREAAERYREEHA